MVDTHGTRRGIRWWALGLAALVALVVGGCAVPTYLQDPPRNFAFKPARDRIPGALVESETLRLQGMRARKRVLVHAKGDAEHLIVNGKPAGKVARVKPGGKIKVAVRAPEALGETAVGLVQINGGTAEFKVTSTRKEPARRLRLGEVEVAPGRTALSRVVAPLDFEPGSELTVEGAGVKVETREGRFDPPVALRPGEPFRLVMRVPDHAAEPIDVRVRLDRLRDTWRIRMP